MGDAWGPGGPDRLDGCPARGARASVRSSTLVSLGLLSSAGAACVAPDPGVSASPPTAASATPSGSALASVTPGASDAASPIPVAPGEEVELAVGDSAIVDGTDVTFTLLEATGPAAGCNDCPNHVRLRVVCPAGPEDLEFAFSGGMDPAAMERARQKSACGVDFYIVEGDRRQRDRARPFASLSPHCRG